MKKLILVRHGRAEEPTVEISDFERSLTTKGKLISKLMAQKLRERENHPGLIITSPAFRALETAIIFAEEYGIKPDNIILNSNLYFKMNLHYVHEILSIIKDDTDTIALFGHNPAFTEIADKLSEEGCDFLPKSGVVGVYFNVRTWKDVLHTRGKLEYFLKPEKAQ
jgi:phosphohistidine phosphatase